ncbi:ABC transporter permease subunit [Nocardioides panacihumi]|uniref:ABC transporter permease subunit n=1 Tax=Nocardioides panacihumi TaxID=400774 RepID=A0ABN2RMU5_9ACTN
MTWVKANADRLVELTWQHLWLSVVPVVIGFLLALPLGWWASRYHRFRAPALTLGGVLYSLPSLPLLVIIPGIIGTSFLDPINVAITLTLYAVALLVRTVADAFGQVSAEVLDAASASGYSRWQRAFGVELPLAGPAMLAGIRVASVSTVSLVTVGALIGVSNLGSLFTEGFQRYFTTEIIVGMVLVVSLALVLDGCWVLVGRMLLPWARGRTA